MNTSVWTSLMTILVLVLVPEVARAEVNLPQLFSDHMVLQRHQSIPVWGQADPDQRVTVSIHNTSRSTTAGEDGHWRVDLPSLKAGGPYRLTVEGSDRTVINDVLIGEVWVCSGQSNMEWHLQNTREAKEDQAVQQAQFDRIRLFKLPRMASETPENRLQKSVKWTPVIPETIRQFSAVGYFFGRRLHRVLEQPAGKQKRIPVGLIQSAWGGSKAEAWTSRSALHTHPQLRSLLSSKEDLKTRHNPAVLHNAMIRPLIPFAIRGAIWYQGESNIGKPYQYRTLFSTMIRDWRDRWQQGDFPFYYVQLAPYDYGNRGSLPLLWEAQLRTHRLLPRTGIAVINDYGNPEDIHPRTKQPVGERLARWALQQVYNQNTVASGPLYERVSIQEDQATIYFKHTGDGLRVRSGAELNQFQIAGPDRTFHPANAKIDGNTVIVHSDDVQHPVAVRYAWGDTAKPNLLNSEGLPASTFRTDGWAVDK